MCYSGKSRTQACIYLLKVNNIKTRTRCEIRQWRRSGIFIVYFEHISHLVLVFLLLSLNMYLPAGHIIREKQ